ncbi:MAG: superfamily protein-like exporter, partial [Solirubrobacterales bacterium]|nr:superfamily protein-like exporter [Solirubrobacterales bacterium]
MSRILASLMAMATRRPVLVVVLTGVLAVAGGAFALLKLEAQTSSDTLVGRGTAEFEASADYAKRFGDDAVYVLVRQPAVQSALTNDLLRLIALEGCLSGALPRGQQPIGGMDGPCGQLARTKPAKVVFGPGTFINTSVGQIQDEFQRQIGAASTRANQVAEAARQVARRQGKSKAAQEKAAGAASQAVTNEFTLTYARLGLKYGLTAPPQLNDTKFVSQLVFDATKPPGTPKSRFAYIFPAKDAALIQVRLKPGLTTPARKQAIETIRAAVRMPDWRLPNGKGSYVVTGAPVVVADLTDSISRGIGVLLVGALLVMALVLAAVFRTRLRLLPLGVAVAATGMTFGLLALVGASLTIATIAVLPVLIGLAVDYAIQLQSRVQEEERAGHPIADAVQAVAQAGVPTVLTAATATAAGFLVLLLSPVPMVRGFGVLVVVGIAIAFVLTLTLGTAVL